MSSVRTICPRCSTASELSTTDVDDAAELDARAVESSPDEDEHAEIPTPKTDTTAMEMPTYRARPHLEFTRER